MEENPIYKFMRENNLTQLDESSFIEKYSNPNEAKKIHGFMVENGLTQLNDADFYSKYFTTTQPIQQEVSVQEPPAQQRQSFRLTNAPATLASIEQDTQGVVKDDAQQEFERNPLITFSKMVAQTFQQMGAGFSAKGAGQISSLSSNQLAKLESIKDVPDDEIIKMPNLTDPRKGMREYKAGDYKRMAAERVVSGNKAAEAALEFAIKNQMELSESDVIQSLTQVKDGWDLVNFITASIGQATAQIPLTVMTGGATSYAMESGNIYLEVVREIAEKEGITPIEVIQQGKDQKALSEIGGALSGALELIGAKKVMEIFGVDNIKKDLRKKAMKIFINSQVEGATEVGQNFISEGAKGLAVEKKLRILGITESLDSYAMGMFGAAGIQAPSLITRGGQKTAQEEQVEEPVSEEVKKVAEEVVEEQVDEIKPLILRVNETDYGFIADADGNLELTQEGLIQSEAESIAKSLGSKYPNREFTVKDNTDPNNPDAEANFTVISSPKTKESYSLAGEQISREQAQEAIQNAESIADLEGLDIQNDQVLMEELDVKVAELEVTSLIPQEQQDKKVIQGGLSELEKGQRNLESVEKTRNRGANHPLFNVGQKYDTRNVVDVRDFKDERKDKSKDGVEVITRVFKPAEVDENGVMTSRAEIEVTIFDSIEQANEFIDSNYEKYKNKALERIEKAKEVTAQERAPSISEQVGNEVTVRVAGENVSGTIQVDEGGKVTLETPQGRIYELDAETPFTEFVRPVTVSEQGEIEVNGEAFSEARIVVEDGQPKALLIREDGTTRAITNPRVVEEIEYQIALANMEAMSDQEADNLYNQYEQQREAETATEEGVTQTDEGTAEDRQLQEAIEEIELIEQLALEELEQAETSAKLVEITPKGAKEPKVYLVRKNEEGTYEATLNGRKVKRQEVLDQLGQAYETETRNLTGRLQEQVNQLKQEVEERLFGKQQADETGQEQQKIEQEQAEVQLQQEEITDERREEKPKTKSTTPVKADTGKKGKGITPKIRELYDKKKPFFDQIKGKFDYPKNATVAKIAKDYDLVKSKPKAERTQKEQEFIDFVDDRIKTPYKKPPSQKGKVALDERELKGKEKKAAKVNPTSIEDIVEQWFIKGGRLSYQGLKELFGQQKIFGEKSIQGEKNARMSYIRTPEKGGLGIQAIVEEITNTLPPQFENVDQMTIRNAVEYAIKDRNSIAQMANSVLNRAGLKEDGVSTPIEDRVGVHYNDAVAEMFSKEEWDAMSFQEKADALNEYYQYPSNFEGAWTAEMVEQFENDILNPTPSEIDWANEMWESMSQEERDLMEQGKLKLDELFSEEESTPQEQPSKFEEGRPKIAERPEMENPVYGVLINGEEKFIQRVEGNDFDQWYEVKKSKDGVWNTIEHFLGFNKKEALDVLYNQSEQKPIEKPSRITFTVFGEKKTGIKQGEEFIADDGTRYKPSMVENVKEVTTIEQQKQLVKDLEKDVIKKLKEGPFDKQGVIFDFKKAMESDKKFYDAVAKLIREYVRLKGMQASEVYNNIERVIKKKLSQDDRKYLKGIIDEVRKEIPKVNVMTETKGLTKDELVKQGLEEILEAKRRDAENKLKQEREKANERVQKAKDKGKAKLDEFKNIKKTMIEFLKMDLADLPVSSFTRGEFQKVLTQIDKSKTDHTLNQAIEQAYDVFADAAKRQRVAEARNLVKRAKTNIKQGKIGVLEPNSLIDQMLRINPKFIPNNIFPLYQSVISELGARKTVLGLSEKGEINQSVMQVLNAVDMQENRVMELKDLYESYQDKDKDFGKTINKMLKEELITDEDAELMRLYKDDILGKPETPPTEKDIDDAIEKTIESVDNINVPDGTYSETEKSIIRTFKSITETDLRDLSYDEVLRVGKIIDNLNNGFVPHLSERMRQRIEGYRSAKAVMPILSSYKGSWTNFISSLKASIKNIKNPRATTTLKEKIRRNPLSYIDQILENFKNTDVYDHVFRKLAKGQASYENDVNTYIETVRRAISKLPQGAKKQFDSRARLMMLAIQREFESNPNQKGVNTAKAFLDATIDDKNSVYSKESKDRLKEIFNQYTDSKGELDSDKLYKDLSPSEKEAYDTINEMNRNMLRPKAMETSTLIRGNRVPIYENYIHLPLAVIGGKQNPTDVKNLQYGFQQTSTRAGSLTERVGKPHAILFDFFANSTEGAKMTLLDYNMTPSIKEVNNTLSKLYTLAQNDKDVDVVKALDDVYNEIMTNVFGIQMSSTSLGEAIIQEAMKKGYQATLSGVGRSSSEFISNAMFAGVYKPTETLNGIKVISKHDEVTLSKVVRNIKSAQSNRLYANSGMENKHIDFSKMNVKEVAKISGYDEGVLERMFRALKQNPAYEFVDQLQAFMVSKPDQLIGRPMFFGAFDQQFEAITGKKPDYQKIADNDTQYMEDNFEAIEEATNFADDVMVEAVASSNPIDGIVRNQVPPSKSAIYAWFKTFNGYMTRFPTYEYNSAVRAVNSLKNNGMLNSQDAVRLLIALNIRLFTYSLLTGTLVKMAYELILKSLFDYEPPEEDVDETVGNVLAKEGLSALAMLAVNRNIGNVGKIPINIALELANKKYGEGVTYEGKYDSFDNSIVYPIIPLDIERGQKPLFQSVLENTAGPLSPQVKTVIRTSTALDRMLTSKKEETRDKYRHELMTRTPFEVLGNLGYIPAYKDLRAMQLQLMYNNVEKAEKATKDKEIDWSKYKK